MLQNLPFKDTRGSTVTNPGMLVSTVTTCTTTVHFIYQLQLIILYFYSSSGVPKLPSFTLKFATSKSFVVSNPVFVIYGTQVLYCNPCVPW